jgi:hypothetical protein
MTTQITAKTSTRLDKSLSKANYILSICKERKRSLAYCLDYAIWICTNDTELSEVQTIIRECYK